MDWLSILGWIGTALIVTAFAFKRSLPARRTATFNLAGAGLLAISFWAVRAWPGVTLQLIWMAVSAVDFLTASHRRKRFQI